MTSDIAPTYTLQRASSRPELQGLWEGPVWTSANTLDIARFHPKSSGHRPVVQARALYDDETLYVAFRVEDRYVRCLRTDYNAMVCSDSCVEFFVEPRPDKGYFNFEMNCGGTLHLSYVEDPTRTPHGFVKATYVPEDIARGIRVYHSLPSVVDPEIQQPVEWRVEYAVPLTLFEHYVGPLGPLPGQRWRANFYKCGDETSHPHWATWAPIGEALNFHEPQYFAPIGFAGKQP